MHLPALLLVSISLLARGAVSTSSIQQARCRCLPSEPCWPSTAEWEAFNTSVSGNLVAVRPIASVCHAPTYDNASCAYVQEHYTNSLFRSSQPGAYQQVQYENSAVTNQTCYADTPITSPCGQGRVPVYAVAARTPSHIQSTIKYATERNLRIVIKNTGHDYLGRSSGRGGLEIWTHNLKNKTYNEAFVASGCNSSTNPERAVTIGAGVQIKELYDYMGENVTGRMVVAGYASTVGVAGGYIQGGGHSALGPLQGMGVDNVLEFTVVTADGAHRTANVCQNSDLFWALRGGGGGTFGVVTSVTLRTFDDPPAVAGVLNVTMSGEKYWSLLETFHKVLPAVSDAGGSGYYYLFNPISNTSSTGTIYAQLFFANHTSTSIITSAFSDFLSAAKNVTNQISLTSDTFPSFYSVYNATLSDSETTGSQLILGSRLLSRELLSSEDGLRRLVDVISQMDANPLVPILGSLVGGGQVARNTHIDVPLNPAWRKTLVHIISGFEWDETTSFAEQKAIQRRLTEEQMPLWKALEPEMGAYTNEADPNDEDWQWDFWGENYEQLRGLKGKWDPENLFRCNRCVGAEDWDEEGICLKG